MNKSVSPLTALIMSLLLASAALAQGSQATDTQGASAATGAQSDQGPTGSQGATGSQAGGAQDPTGAQGTQGEPNPAPPTAPSTRPAPGAGAAAPSMSAAGSELAAPDKSFIKDAALANLEEVELGRLAAEKASSPDVKSFAQKMADDHKQVADRLKDVAAALKYDPPSRPPSRTKSEKGKLEKLSGIEFDRAYLDLVLKNHQKDVSVFEREARREAAPSGLKNFASSTLQSLQDHLKMAQELNAKLSGAGAASSSSPGRQQ
jgi:putative membrane protein